MRKNLDGHHIQRNEILALQQQLQQCSVKCLLTENTAYLIQEIIGFKIAELLEMENGCQRLNKRKFW